MCGLEKQHPAWQNSIELGNSTCTENHTYLSIYKSKFLWISLSTFLKIITFTNGRIYASRQKRCSDIREQLGIFDINDKLTQNKINWREHIQRMDNKLRKKNQITNLKGEGHKQDGEMISGRKEQAKGPKPYG